MKINIKIRKPDIRCLPYKKWDGINSPPIILKTDIDKYYNQITEADYSNNDNLNTIDIIQDLYEINFNNIEIGDIVEISDEFYFVSFPPVKIE